MGLFHWMRRGMAALGLAAMAGSAPAQIAAAAPAVSVARPALWSVADADTTIYLFGTIHMLPPNYAWRSAALDQALTSSDSLYVETLIDERNPASIRAELTSSASATGSRRSRVCLARQAAALYTTLTRLKLPLAAMDRMENLAAASLSWPCNFRLST